MAGGLIFGALARGLGEGGNKYIELEEKKRAEDAAHQQRFQEMDLAARQRSAEKDDDQARKDRRMMDFKREADAWREKNPKGSIDDFVQHFATSEYSDLLGASLAAAGLERQSKQLEATIAHQKAMERNSAAGLGLQAASASRAERRLALDEADAMEKRDAKKKAQGMLAGYLTTEGNPVAHAAYRRELQLLGMDPEAGDMGTSVEKSKVYDPKTGSEVETTTTRKNKAPRPNTGPAEGAENTGMKFNGADILRDAKGKLFYFNKEKGKYIELAAG